VARSRALLDGLYEREYADRMKTMLARDKRDFDEAQEKRRRRTR
jgi:hypothetical protein